MKGALLRPVSRAAWAAALAGLPDLAERWASRAAASSDSGPRTWSDMTRVQLALQALGPAGDTSLAPVVVAAHVKALEQLEVRARRGRGLAAWMGAGGVVTIALA